MSLQHPHKHSAIVPCRGFCFKCFDPVVVSFLVIAVALYLILCVSIVGLTFMLDLYIKTALRPYINRNACTCTHTHSCTENEEGIGCLRGQWLLVIHAQFAAHF